MFYVIYPGPMEILGIFENFDNFGIFWIFFKFRIIISKEKANYDGERGIYIQNQLKSTGEWYIMICIASTIVIISGGATHREDNDGSNRSIHNFCT